MKIAKAMVVWVRKFDGVEDTTLEDAVRRGVDAWTTPAEAWDSIVADYDSKAAIAEAGQIRIREIRAAAEGK